MSINIVVLGGSGAGKSIYLASLLKKLDFPDLDLNSNPSLSLQLVGKDENEVDRQRQRLYKICNDLVGSSENFPPGTSGIEEWVFQCGIGQYKNTSINFSFLDYAGGIITDSNQGLLSRQELNKSIRRANIIFVLLDGIQVINLVRDHNSNALISWLQKDIPNMFSDIKKVNTDIPIHFIITKWDCLIHLNLADLKDIKAKLLERVKELKSLVNDRNNKIRLIPVASLGKNFAIPEYDNQNNFKKMKKTANHSKFEPYLVEVPLAYALYDALEHKVEKIENRKKGIRKVLQFLNFFTDYLPLPDPLNMFTKKTANMMIKIVSKESAHRRPFDNVNLKPTSEHEAIKAVANVCADIITSFNDDFPNSLLSSFYKF